MEFHCRLASPSGEVIEGVYSAESEAALRHEFDDKGLFLLQVRAKGSLAGLSLHLPQRRRLPGAEFLVFNQELATLLKAGMPLVQSLDLLKRRVETPVFRAMLEDVHEQVRSGTALSDAFAAHDDLVPRVFVASLVAGERSGNLDAVLRRYVEHTKILAAVKKKTISALVYPAILVTLSLVLVAFMVLRVVPAFTDFYASFGADLPLATRIIVGVSAFVRGHALLLVAAVGVAAVALAAWIRQPGQHARFDRLILGLPFLGGVARKFGTSQMARTLATLLGGGLPLVNALDITARSVGNRFMAAELQVVAERVREGESFAAALDRRHVFPDVAVKMAEVGESTGALQDMLSTVADFYDEEIATTMDRFMTLIEPTLLVLMGIVIAGLVLALYMPLFQLSSVLGGGS
jgi:type IV pilus assembly protein PilC